MHSDGISSAFRESVSCSVVAACVIEVVFGGATRGSVGRLGLAFYWRLASLRSLVRQCICRFSNFGIGGRSFCDSVCVGGCAMGHIVCACLGYVCNICMTCLAALYMCCVERFWEGVRSWRESQADI